MLGESSTFTSCCRGTSTLTVSLRESLTLPLCCSHCRKTVRWSCWDRIKGHLIESLRAFGDGEPIAGIQGDGWGLWPGTLDMDVCVSTVRSKTSAQVVHTLSMRKQQFNDFDGKSLRNCRPFFALLAWACSWTELPWACRRFLIACARVSCCSRASPVQAKCCHDELFIGFSVMSVAFHPFCRSPRCVRQETGGTPVSRKRLHPRSTWSRPPLCMTRAWKRRRVECLLMCFFRCSFKCRLIIDRLGRPGPWWPQRFAVTRSHKGVWRRLGVESEVHHLRLCVGLRC